jgi:hypothetical protein
MVNQEVATRTLFAARISSLVAEKLENLEIVKSDPGRPGERSRLAIQAYFDQGCGEREEKFQVGAERSGSDVEFGVIKMSVPLDAQKRTRSLFPGALS